MTVKIDPFAKIRKRSDGLLSPEKPKRETVAMTNLGLFDNVPSDEYHALDALSSSALKELARSPAHLLEYLTHKPEPTAAMHFGTATHSAVLENGLETGAVIKGPAKSRVAAAWGAFADANPGKIIVTHDEYARIENVVEAIRKHPTASLLLAGGKAEQSALWKDPATGVYCKCRPDYLRPDNRIIDLKTSADASPEGFQRSIMKYKYHWQSAWYLDGMSQVLGTQLEDLVHLVVETEAPYGIGIYVLDNESLDKAREDIKKLLAKYVECLHTGEWAGYAAGIQNISIPSWGFHEEVA